MLVKSIKCVFSAPSKCCLLYALLPFLCNFQQVMSASVRGVQTQKVDNSSSMFSNILSKISQDNYEPFLLGMCIWHLFITVWRIMSTDSCEILQKENDKLKNEITALNSQSEEAVSKWSQSEKSVSKLSAEVSDLKSKLQQLEIQNSKCSATLDKSRRLNELRSAKNCVSGPVQKDPVEASENDKPVFALMSVVRPACLSVQLPTGYERLG